jgi:hypothetical protein
MSDPGSAFETAERLRLTLTSHATGGAGDELEFKRLRAEVLNGKQGRLAPGFLRACRTLSDFWSFIKPKFAKYQERREYLRNEFDPLLTALEGAASPVDARAGELTRAYDADYVHGQWQKALDRRATDPEGAITAARTLLETTCKHLLDDMKIVYASDADLPGLYSTVAKGLELAPSHHTEKIFKQILGGCQAVVEGLGALRNKVSDAHGQGQRPVRPGGRHAELAVNLAGSMAVFLLSTHEERRAGRPASSAAVGGKA